MCMVEQVKPALHVLCMHVIISKNSAKVVRRMDHNQTRVFSSVAFRNA